MGGFDFAGFLAQLGAGDPSMGLLVLILGFLMAAATVIVAAAFRAPVKRAAEKAGKMVKRKPPVDELLKRVGIDEAMTRIFSARLRKALDEGLVRPALAHEGCDGWVVYDFARDDWICMNRSGVAYPLGGEPEGESVEVEEEETAGGG